MNLFSAHDYFEDQYVLRKSLPTFLDHVAEWEALSTDDNFTKNWHTVESYGEHPRQTFEVFKQERDKQAKGLAIFIHGGFWRAMDREQSRFMATPFLENGYDCVIAEYRLMPEFRLADLVEDTALMLVKIQKISKELKLSENVILSGHSAGAHLAVFGLEMARKMGCELSGCDLLLFSGVFDVFPVSRTSIGDELNMSDDEIAEWSVYREVEYSGKDPLFIVGEKETDDFIRQSIIGSQQLSKNKCKNITLIPDANHLTLMTKFATNSKFNQDVIRQIEITSA